MKKLFIHQLGNYASSYYRQSLPARHVKTPGLAVTCDTDLRSLGHDTFWLPLLFNPGFLPVIESLKREGKQLVWETDDDLWRIPSWNPACRAYNLQAVATVTWAARIADHVVVTTPALKDAVAFNADVDPAKVTALPNLLDLNDWPELPPRETGPVRILWAGSQHHEKDLEEVVGPLEHLMDEFKGGVMVYFFGDWPQGMAEWARIRHTHLSCQVPHSKYNQRLGFVNAVALQDYPRTLCAIRPDIALAPLCDDLFNHSKSGIKWYECAMAGAAVVATDLPPYRQIRDGVDGLLVKPGDEGAWIDSVRKLVEDKKYRERMARNARERVISEFAWQNGPGKKEWETFFGRLAE